jgi:hypothetical protein
LLSLLLCNVYILQDPELFELLARATLNRMHELSPHSLSDLTWAFAAARQPNAAAVLAAAAPAAAESMERFSAGMLADMLWSYASVGVRDEALLAAAAKVGGGSLINSSFSLNSKQQLQLASCCCAASAKRQTWCLNFDQSLMSLFCISLLVPQWFAAQILIACNQPSTSIGSSLVETLNPLALLLVTYVGNSHTYTHTMCCVVCRCFPSAA